MSAALWLAVTAVALVVVAAAVVLLLVRRNAVDTRALRRYRRRYDDGLRRGPRRRDEREH
jgi:hypothetical protein